jgi:hypothetical protein
VTFNVSGSTGTVAKSISDSGKIAGWWLDSSGVPHGFLRTAGGTIVTFDPSGSTATYPQSVARGRITGYYVHGSHTRGFVRTP